MPEQTGNMLVRRSLAQGPDPTFGWYVPQPFMTLDGLSAQEYNQFFKGQIKDAVDTVRFDTLRIIAGTAIGLTDKLLFNTKAGDNTTTADGGQTYKKDKVDTNMKVANEMEFGNVLIVESFQVEVMNTAQLATADTVNRITDPTAASAAATTASASLNLFAFLSQCWIEFKVGDRTVLEGRPLDWPSQGGIYGFAGGADEGIVQNGFGFARSLRNIVVLRAGEQFGVTLTPYTNITPTIDINCVVKLAGVRLRPVG
jgi:hypothetical protein